VNILSYYSYKSATMENARVYVLTSPRYIENTYHARYLPSLVGYT